MKATSRFPELLILALLLLALPALSRATTQTLPGERTITVSQPDSNPPQGPMKMLRLLDQLDRLDFDDAIRKAEACLARMDLPCARTHIDEAAPFANDPESRKRLSGIETRLAVKLRFSEALNRAQLAVLERDFHQAERDLLLADQNALDAKDRSRLSALSQALSEERRQVEREKREQAELERQQRELANLKRESRNTPHETNEWVGTAMTFIDQMTKEATRIQQQEHARTMARIAAERAMKKRMAAQKREVHRRNAEYRKKRQREEEARKREKRRVEEKMARLRAQKARLETRWQGPTISSSPASGPAVPPSGPRGLAIVWKQTNGLWYADGPVQKTLTGSESRMQALDYATNAATTFLTTLPIHMGKKEWECAVYRVDRVVDTERRPGGTRNLRLFYPELAKLKPMGLD